MSFQRTAALLSALGLGSLTAAGCGGSGSRGTASGPPSPSVTAYTQAELQARVLSLSDLPAGFTVDSDSGNADGKLSSPDPNCKALVDIMNDEGKPAGSVAEAEAYFSKGQLGPFVGTGLASFPTVQAATDVLSQVTKAMQSCKTITETDPDGSTYTFTLAPLSFPPTGDASSATRMTANVGGYPATVDTVLARVGTTLMYVSNVGLGNTDSDLTRQLTDKAVAKVRNPAAAGTPSASRPSSSA